MTEYPYELSGFSSGAFKLEFPDLPTLQLVGKSHYVLRLEAAWTLNAFLSIRIRRGLSIPYPSMAQNSLQVDDHVDFRLRLHWSMQDSGMTREELADDLDLSLNTVENMLDGEVESESNAFLEAVATQDLDIAIDANLTSIVGENVSNRTANIALLAI